MITVARETIEDTKQQKEKALEAQKARVSHTARLPSGKFTFQLPSHLQQLYDKILAERLENERLIEESEKTDSPETELARLKIDVFKRRQKALDTIENELLKFQFYEKAWFHIREELTELSEITDEIAIFFVKTNEGYWGVEFAILDNGKLKRWKKPVIFPESPFKGSTKVLRKKRK